MKGMQKGIQQAIKKGIQKGIQKAGAPYVVRPTRPRSYLDFEK